MKKIIVFISILLASSVAAENVIFTYDSLNRLTSTTYSSGQIIYVYDSNGNITQVTATPDASCPDTLYRDGDNDGYGDPAISIQTCPQTGFVTDNTDCNDDPITGQYEHPNQVWYPDSDGDGYYSGATNTTSCTRPANTFAVDELTTVAVVDNCPSVANPDQADTDSDDVGDACDAFPGDTAYSLDIDSDGIADEWENQKFNNDLNVANATSDQDGDGITDLEEFRINRDPVTSIYQNYVPQADHDQAIADKDTEIGTLNTDIKYLQKGDLDKSGSVDGADLNTFSKEYGKTEIDVDNDSDTFTEIDGDCDDTDAAINPNATEVCADGIDNNCDGTVDEGC